MKPRVEILAHMKKFFGLVQKLECDTVFNLNGSLLLVVNFIYVCVCIFCYLVQFLFPCLFVCLFLVSFSYCICVSVVCIYCFL